LDIKGDPTGDEADPGELANEAVEKGVLEPVWKGDVAWLWGVDNSLIASKFDCRRFGVKNLRERG